MKPAIGLAPMDGITDAAFREIVDIYGHPDLLFTEFVPVEAVSHGVVRVMPALLKHKTKTKTIAQFFGRDLKSYYKAVFIAASLGYDGIDINMGCPDRNIAKKGGGAGLIGDPILAVSIIKTVREAVNEWKEGKTLEQAKIPGQITQWIKKRIPSIKRRKIQVSVKTRTGLDKPITHDWISRLVSAQPDMISVHGRTLIQMYRGKADWEEIGKAAVLAKKAGIVFFGNGDIKSVNQGRERAIQYGCDGVLIGRAGLGNPWVFSEKTPTLKERINVMREHARIFLSLRPDLKLYPMRKHLAWYTAGIIGSRSFRNSLMQVVSLQDLDNLLGSLGT